MTERFAFLGPFETNQMGNRALFLWVALPMENPAGSSAPTVLVDGAALELGAAGTSAEFAGLARVAVPDPDAVDRELSTFVSTARSSRGSAPRPTAHQAVDQARRAARSGQSWRTRRQSPATTRLHPMT